MNYSNFLIVCKLYTFFFYITFFNISFWKKYLLLFEYIKQINSILTPPQKKHGNNNENFHFSRNFLVILKVANCNTKSLSFCY